MWQSESQSGTGSIPVVLVLLYFIICFLQHIVTGYCVNGSMQCWFESSYPDQWCIVHRRSAKLGATIQDSCQSNVVQGSIPYCSILRQYLMRYLLLIVRNNKMRQSQLAVYTNGKRGFDSYYCYKIREKQIIGKRKYFSIGAPH